MKSSKNPILLILALIFLAAGCSDSSIGPVEEKPALKGADFGLMEVTISGVGTNNMTATAHFIKPNIALSLTEPSGSNGSADGTIQIEPVSNGSFTYGTRGSGGVRYISATFKVRNANEDGLVYPNTRHNLTFMAVDTDQTFGISSVSTLRLFDGTELTGPAAQTIAATIIPTGAARLLFDGSVQPNFIDVLQIHTEGQLTSFSAPPSVNNVFPYGFITRSPNITPGSRDLPANPSSTTFDGMVTFAFKIQLQSQANQDPFEISALFLPVDDSDVHMTQSIEEQNANGNALLYERINNLTPLYLMTFPGSTYRGQGFLVCTPVRVTGPAGSPATTLFAAPSTFSSVSPDAYAPNGSASHISAATTFTAVFGDAINRADAARFVVRGSQSGIQSMGESYTGIGTSTISTPAANFYPGEMVEVSITSGLDICEGAVYRYRAAAGGGALLNFFIDGTYMVGFHPRDITAGDWNNDGHLDLAVQNSGGGTNTISVLVNNGNGTFASEVRYPVGAGAEGIISGDWNEDGDLDLVVTNHTVNNISVLLGNGNGTFNPQLTFAAGEDPTSSIAGDWDADGDLDLVVANGAIDKVTVLRSNGDGTFVAGTAYQVGDFPTCINSGDWNADGALDIAVGNLHGDTINILLGNGNGTFVYGATLATGDAPWSIATGDWDIDGVVDLAVTNLFDGNISVMLGNGDGTFAGQVTYPAGNHPTDITSGDWDADGDLDLIAVNNDDDTISVLFSNGNGTFAPQVSYQAGGDEPTFIIAGDFNGDTGLDIALTNYGDDNISVLEHQ